MSECALSVVIIARNEAAHIERAIQSVLAGVKAWPQAEILLVDSASTDQTVEIARRYPISIVRLRPEQFRSAAAGRYLGMLYTRGEFILHLDGDMELEPGWLEQALPFLAAHPESAGVDGYYRNLHVRDGRVLSEERMCEGLSDRVSATRYFCGAALYRRSALEAVGGFNPYLISEEEPELSIRLRHAGFTLNRLPALLCTHYGPIENSWEYIFRRSRTNLWAGYGQVPRYHLRSGLLGTVIRERSAYTLLYLLGLLGVIGAGALALFFRSWWPLAGVALALVGILVVFWVKKRSLSETFKSLWIQTVVAYSAVRGFLMEPRLASDYPTAVEIIQTQPCYAGFSEVRT
ncbi:MAG: glycosyltransferase family A protein [Anaerolineae bacterium]|nr:glycosyltransferase family A protein [Anaerolineae bacterium]